MKMANSFDFAEQMTQGAREVESALQTCIPKLFPGAPEKLLDAMQYSLMAGGKRIRPVMLLESCRLTGADTQRALPFACAVEMIHTYSLIHDDLPAMDNDDLRRGKPTSHKMFGEAMAILAGDALLNGAFEAMSRACLAAPELVPAMVCVARASGACGMIGGQVLDMAAQQDVEQTDRLKTGALLRCAVEAGLLCGGADEATKAKMLAFAEDYGVLFQITDDLLDVLSTPEILGKSVGKDQRDEKATFVAKYGLNGAKRLADDYAQRCREHLGGVSRAVFFSALLTNTIERKK
ncbi:MAG: polyprenyl synthetase family protein [Eubacteriales bacterium]|nr:polyprenyl synthetase family protein [Eubacteriales bacterium]